MLACGKDEVREEHVHGPGCFKLAVTSTSDEPIAAEVDAAAGTVRFEGSLAGLDEAPLMEVAVTGPAEAFPTGTTMSLAAVAEAEVADAVQQAVDAQVSAVQSVDISFHDAAGAEIEPAAELAVTLRSPFVADNDELMVVHITDAGKAETVRTLGSLPNAQDELSFETDRFSTYCLVAVDEGDGEPAETADPTADGYARELVAGTESYRITMTCPEEAHIPANAQLEVSELREASRAYASYVGRVSDNLPEGADVTYARLFDITITVDGQEIQPEAPVSVRVDLMDEARTEVADDEELMVAHFSQESPRVPNEVQAQMEGEGAESAVSFEADSFSIYAIVVTHIEKTVLAADGNTYHISVSYTSDAGLPEGTELEVHEVADTSRAYDRYLTKASEALGDDLEPTFARFFDITLVKDGKPVQPNAPVSVTVELADELTSDARALHFGNQVEVLDVAEAEPELFDHAVSFEAEGFSVYGIVEVEDKSHPASGYTGNDPDGMTLYISNKRSSTEYYLINAQKDANWMNQVANMGSAQAFLFTKVGEGSTRFRARVTMVSRAT